MRSIFSYDSKLMQALTFAADVILLNLAFLVCSLPVVTGGAALAGLHTGIRTLFDQENETPPLRAFFRGFAEGFWTVTGMHVILLAIGAAVVWTLSNLMLLRAEGVDAPVWVSIAALAVLAVFHTAGCYFHSRFGCRFGQFWRNTLYVVIFCPIQSLLLAALFWLPAGVFLLDLDLFIALTPLWLALYFSLAAILGHFLMKRSFEKIRVMTTEEEAAEEGGEPETSERTERDPVR